MSLLLLFSSKPSVWISPTDDVDDAGAVEQTITAWSATEITFTSVQGGLPTATDVYLFVVTAAGDSNAAGFVVQFTAGTIFAPPHFPLGIRRGMHRRVQRVA